MKLRQGWTPRARHAARALLGTPALIFALASLLMFVLGLVIAHREYDRLSRWANELTVRVLERWARTASADYLGVRNLVDEVEAWCASPPAAEPAAQERASEALQRLGRYFETLHQRAPLLEVLSLSLARSDRHETLRWQSRSTRTDGDRSARIPLLDAPDQPRAWLDARYQVEPEIQRLMESLEVSYRRLLLAVVGLSGYSLLCLIYTGLHAESARRQAAREAAREATIDLADRTCHELGNLAYVLANEGRNLADQLDVFQRLSESQDRAFESALRSARIADEQARAARAAWDRQRQQHETDSETVQASLELAREVCEQIATGSKYLTLTVRELDSYLKQSTFSLQLEPIAVESCVEDALLLLAPAILAARARVDRGGGSEQTATRVLADRRLLVHAIVNLIKNALEATAGAKTTPRIGVAIAADDQNATITISDNGPGVPPADLPRLFDVGYSTKGASRGRGMAIVKNSIERQSGRVEVESQPGAGTKVRITLPREGARKGLSGSFLGRKSASQQSQER